MTIEGRQIKEKSKGQSGWPFNVQVALNQFTGISFDLRLESIIFSMDNTNWPKKDEHRLCCLFFVTVVKGAKANLNLKERRWKKFLLVRIICLSGKQSGRKLHEGFFTSARSDLLCVLLLRLVQQKENHGNDEQRLPKTTEKSLPTHLAAAPRRKEEETISVVVVVRQSLSLSPSLFSNPIFKSILSIHRHWTAKQEVAAIVNLFVVMCPPPLLCCLLKQQTWTVFWANFQLSLRSNSSNSSVILLEQALSLLFACLSVFVHVHL